MRPVPHSENLPIPHLPTHLTLEDESEHEAATEVPKEEQDDATFETSTSSCEPHLLTQGELNDLFGIWNCPKNRPNFWVLN